MAGGVVAHAAGFLGKVIDLGQEAFRPDLSANIDLGLTSRTPCNLCEIIFLSGG